MPREKLSVCVITYEEEHNLDDCLDSVRFADEIIVVDSRSSDRTAEIARRYTDRVIVRDWPGHVAQKGFAAEQASGDWILPSTTNAGAWPRRTGSTGRTWSGSWRSGPSPCARARSGFVCLSSMPPTAFSCST